MSARKAVKPITLATAGGLVAVVCLVPVSRAQSGDAGVDADSTRLETLTVEGNRLYQVPSSEETGGYAVDAATVGTKTPAALRDIPQSVSVVTREAMDDQNLDTLDQLGRRTPGMRVLSNDDGRSSIYARGYEYSEFNIDGLPVPMQSINGTVPSLSAIDRVEVMRGPSGLFNSTSEMGGIVNLVRKRPTRRFQGHLDARYGSIEQRYLGADVAGPLDADGDVRGRVVADHNEHAAFADYNDNIQNDVYAALDVDLGTDTTLSLGYLHNDKDITVNNGLPTDADGDLVHLSEEAFFGAEWNDFDSRSDDWIAALTHDFANGGYGRVAARYSDRHADYNYAFGGSALDANDTVAVAGIGSVVDQQSLSLDASYSQPFEAFGSVSEFVVGADYKRYDTETESGRTRSLTAGRVTESGIHDIAHVDILEAARSGTGGYRYSDERTVLRETGLYSKLTLRPVSSLALIGGARVSRYSVDYDNRAGGTHADREGDAEVTPYAGVVYDLNYAHSVYASYSQVFKPQTAVGADGDLIEPREGDQYEVGIKGSYMGGALNARVSAFRLYDENRAAASSDPGANYSVPVGEMRIQGGEFEVTGNLTEQWQVIAGYTYLDTEVKEASTARNDGIFLLMPHNMFNLWTQYAFSGGALDGLHVGGGVTAVSDFSSSQDVEAPGYAVVDAMVGYDFTRRLSAQVNLNNVFDRDYYTRVGGVNTFNMVGEPFNVVASLRYDF